MACLLCIWQGGDAQNSSKQTCHPHLNRAWLSPHEAPACHQYAASGSGPDPWSFRAKQSDMKSPRALIRRFPLSSSPPPPPSWTFISCIFLWQVTFVSADKISGRGSCENTKIALSTQIRGTKTCTCHMTPLPLLCCTGCPVILVEAEEGGGGKHRRLCWWQPIFRL